MRFAPCAAFIVLAACSDRPATPAVEDATVEPPPRPVPSGPYDTAQLLADLEAQGVRVSTIPDDNFVRGLGNALNGRPSWLGVAGGRPLAGTVNAGGQCELPGAVTAFRINGETVVAYDLPDPAAALEATARVGCTGDVINGCILEWNSEPHYFTRGRIVVEHVGSQGTAATLRSILGAPFAGEGSACLAHLKAEVSRANDQIARGDVGTIHGVAHNARGRAEDLLVVRVAREGWSTVDRTGWATYGAARKRGELSMTGVPAGRMTVEVSRFEPNARVLWTKDIDVIAGKTVELDVRVP